ncbi:hypothetical protein D3C73_1470430 [compost metagenome]
MNMEHVRHRYYRQCRYLAAGVEQGGELLGSLIILAHLAGPLPVIVLCGNDVRIQAEQITAMPPLPDF